MIRLLGMRLMTRLLLVVCSLSLVSILFLSRCGLSTLEPENQEDGEGQAAAQAELPGNVVSLIPNLTHSKFRVSSQEILTHTHTHARTPTRPTENKSPEKKFVPGNVKRCGSRFYLGMCRRELRPGLSDIPVENKRRASRR